MILRYVVFNEPCTMLTENAFQSNVISILVLIPWERRKSLCEIAIENTTHCGGPEDNSSAFSRTMQKSFVCQQVENLDGASLGGEQASDRTLWLGEKQHEWETTYSWVYDEIHHRTRGMRGVHSWNWRLRERTADSHANSSSVTFV